MIEVKHLTKCYGQFKAIDDLSFTVKEGEIYGFLGPNGAGKSTTMNIMTGCLSATSGTVKIAGYDIFENACEAKKQIGYLPEVPPLYLDLTPKEYLYFVAEAKGIERHDRPGQVARVIQETQIGDVQNKLIQHLSKGYRQRVGIAQALIGNPKVIILDEPTVGLDPKQIIEIRTLIKELGKKHTVILSSHILSEVQAICETIMIISKGRLIACDSPEHLQQMFQGTITIALMSDANEAELDQIMTDVPDVQNYHIQPKKDGWYDITIEFAQGNEMEQSRHLFFAFANAGKAIIQMGTVKATLEDVFIELTEGEKEKKEVNVDVSHSKA